MSWQLIIFKKISCQNPAILFFSNYMYVFVKLSKNDLFYFIEGIT